jgi:hypothetical protein
MSAQCRHKKWLFSAIVAYVMSAMSAQMSAVFGADIRHFVATLMSALCYLEVGTLILLTIKTKNLPLKGVSLLP